MADQGIDLRSRERPKTQASDYSSANEEEQHRQATMSTATMSAKQRGEHSSERSRRMIHIGQLRKESHGCIEDQATDEIPECSLRSQDSSVELCKSQPGRDGPKQTPASREMGQF